MKIVWTRAAVKSLKSVRQYIQVENPTAARAVAAEIRSSVERLAAFPRSGRPGLEVGTRELLVTARPYYVVYRVADTEVQILRVFHHKQNRD